MNHSMHSIGNIQMAQHMKKINHLGKNKDFPLKCGIAPYYASAIQRGVTLIELLVGISIGLLVIALLLHHSVIIIILLWLGLPFFIKNKVISMLAIIVAIISFSILGIVAAINILDAITESQEEKVERLNNRLKVN